MKRFIYFILILSLCFSTQSCHRKAVHKVQPDFIGNWYHREINGEKWHIEIDKKSWGTITVYNSENKDLNKFGENPRRWRYNEKHQELTNGIISDYFGVNQVPATTEVLIINGYDTIPAGRTYCIINNDYYLKSQ